MTASNRAAQGDRSADAAAPPIPTLPAWLRIARWGVPLIGILLIAGFAYARFRPAPSQLTGGAVVTGRQLAPDFTLTDQFGQPQALSGFHGKAVALTFIYTNCTDVCPLIAWNMHLAYQQLGDQAKNVALVAVTVDPERDTPAQVRAFSDQRELTYQWWFLTGSRPALEQVWRAYGIQAQAYDASGTPIPESDVSQATPEEVEHAAPTFLIDKQGYVRVLLPIDFTADTLASDLRILATES